jgi:hypothetical protein
MTQDASLSGTPGVNVSKLDQSLEKILDQNRIFFEEMTRMARQESLRFAALRLERMSQAVDHLHDFHGFGGLVSTQHEFLRELMQDYASQGMRIAERLCQLTTHSLATARDAAQESGEAAAEAVQAMEEHAEDIVNRADGYAAEAAPLH